MNIDSKMMLHGAIDELGDCHPFRIDMEGRILHKMETRDVRYSGSRIGQFHCFGLVDGRTKAFIEEENGGITTEDYWNIRFVKNDND